MSTVLRTGRSHRSPSPAIDINGPAPPEFVTPQKKKRFSLFRRLESPTRRRMDPFPPLPENDPLHLMSDPHNAPDLRDPGLMRKHLIALAAPKTTRHLDQRLFNGDAVDPRDLESMIGEITEALRQIPPGPDHDVMQPLIAELEALPDRFYQGVSGYAVKTGRPPEAAIATEILADKFDELSRLSSETAKAQPKNSAAGDVAGWLAVWLFSVKRMARAKSVHGLLNKAGESSFNNMRRESDDHENIRVWSSNTRQNSISATIGAALTPAIAALKWTANFTASKTYNVQIDKDNDANFWDLKGKGVGTGLSFSIGPGQFSGGASFTEAHGPFAEAVNSPAAFAIYKAMRNSQKHGLSARYANAGARRRFERLGKFANALRLLVHGQRSLYEPDDVRYANEKKTAPGVSPRGARNALAQLGTHISSLSRKPQIAEQFTSMADRYLPGQRQVAKAVASAEPEEIGKIIGGNVHGHLSAPAGITQNMKASQSAWSQKSLAATLSAGFTPKALLASAGVSSTILDNVPLPGAGLNAGLLLKKRKLWMSRIHKPLTEQTRPGYLGSTDHSLDLIGSVWKRFGEREGVTLDPESAHPMLRLAAQNGLTFGREFAGKPLRLDRQRQQFYGDPRAMAASHRMALAKLSAGGDPGALAGEITAKLASLQRQYQSFLTDAEEAGEGTFMPRDPALARINARVFGGQYPLKDTDQSRREMTADATNAFSIATFTLGGLLTIAKHEMALRQKTVPLSTRENWTKSAGAADDQYKRLATLQENPDISATLESIRRRGPFTSEGLSGKETAYVNFSANVSASESLPILGSALNSKMNLLPTKTAGGLGFSVIAEYQKDLVRSHPDIRTGSFDYVGHTFTHPAPASFFAKIAKTMGRRLGLSKPDPELDDSVKKDIADAIAFSGTGLLLNQHQHKIDTQWHRPAPFTHAGRNYKLPKKIETKRVWSQSANAKQLSSPNVTQFPLHGSLTAQIGIGDSNSIEVVRKEALGPDLLHWILRYDGDFRKLLIRDKDGGFDLAAIRKAFKNDAFHRKSLFSEMRAPLDLLDQMLKSDPKNPLKPFVDVDGRETDEVSALTYFMKEKRMKLLRNGAVADHFSPGSGEDPTAKFETKTPLIKMWEEAEHLRKTEPDLLPRIASLYAQQKDWTPEQQLDFYTLDPEGRRLFTLVLRFSDAINVARFASLAGKSYRPFINEDIFDIFPDKAETVPAGA